MPQHQMFQTLLLICLYFIRGRHGGSQHFHLDHRVRLFLFEVSDQVHVAEKGVILFIDGVRERSQWGAFRRLFVPEFGVLQRLEVIEGLVPADRFKLVGFNVLAYAFVVAAVIIQPIPQLLVEQLLRVLPRQILDLGVYIGHSPL